MAESNGSSSAIMPKTEGMSEVSSQDSTKPERLNARQLAPTEVIDRWAVLWPSLERMLSPDVALGPVREAGFMSGFKMGSLQCWALETTVANPGRMVGMAVTTLMGDPYLGLKNLVVYGLFTMEYVGLVAWKSLEEALVGYARANGCQAVYAETTNARVVEIAQEMGFTSSTTLRRRID